MSNSFNSALSDFIFQSKYSKYRPDLGRKETFEESVDRISQMHMKHLTDEYPQALEDSEFCNDFMEAIESYKKQLIYGSQRALQFGGDPILRKNARLFNCAFTYCDRLEVFKEIEWMLLCGCGVGISVEHQHISKLGHMSETLNKGTYQHVVDDSIEGWAIAFDSLINYYFREDYHYPIFDFSKVRPNGAPISGGFLAPGPDGLKKSLQKVDEVLKNAYYNNNKTLRSIDIADIIAFEADSVLSGGVRRSAVSILFDPDDENMFNSKIGNWWYENPQRGRYNASAVLERDSTSREIYDKLFKATREYGEPGFVWRSDKREGYNPCFEVGFCPIDEYGNTGWQVCNLVSISGQEITNSELFYKACKDASTLATIQATYMKFPFLGEVTERIIKNDPLIGVSISGIMTNPDILLDSNILRYGAGIIKNQNSKVARALGIKEASRTTVIKPDGNLGAMSGNTSGCHGDHAKKYIRRVQVNKEEEAGQIYAKYNPRAIKESIWSNNHTDNCIMFAIEAKPGSVLKEDLLGVNQLEIVKKLQNNWIRTGKRIESDTIENNVSNTVQVDNWEEVQEYVWDNRYDLSGVSFIGAINELDYNQPAYSKVLDPQEMLSEYGEGIIFASGIIVDAEEVFGDLWRACDVLNGKGEKIFSTLEDAEEFVKTFNIAKREDYLDKPLKEWIEVNNSQYSKWIELLTEIGYSEEFAEQLLDSDIEIPLTEIQKYLDTKMYDTIDHLSEKRDLIRRLNKYADKYFNGEISIMIEALKYVQLYHDWCDITKYYQPVDWESVKWKKVTLDADTMAAASCSGGACEITKL